MDRMEQSRMDRMESLNIGAWIGDMMVIHVQGEM